MNDIKITWVKKRSKYVIKKEGVYFSLTLKQILEMEVLLKEIKASPDYNLSQREIPHEL